MVEGEFNPNKQQKENLVKVNNFLMKLNNFEPELYHYLYDTINPEFEIAE